MRVKERWGRYSNIPKHVFAGLCTAFNEAAIRGVHDAIGCRVGMNGIHEAKAAASLFSYPRRKGSSVKRARGSRWDVIGVHLASVSERLGQRCQSFDEDVVVSSHELPETSFTDAF